MATNDAINVGLSGVTGTGNFVGSTSPSLTTPTLGTPASGNLANCTMAGRLIAIQTFIATGTYTPTTGMTHCVIQCVGGGGAGGGTPSVSALASATGSGGGSGSFSQSYVTSATIGASKAVTIGAAGTGSSNSNGGNGGDTSVGTIVIGKGGTGGIVGTAGAFITGGSAGGVAGTGDITFPGNPGLWCINYSYVNAVSGQGGNSHLGGATLPIVTATSAGTAAVANTGSGGSGIVIIYEYS